MPLCQPTYGSVMRKPRGNLSEMLFFVHAVAFSLKNPPKHNEPHVAERTLQFLLSGS